MVNTTIPLWYSPAVAASFFPPLAAALAPVVPALAEAEAVIAMAPTLPPNSKLPDVNSSRAKPALEGLSLQLAVTFAAVPVQDVAVHGAMCGIDQEDQRPTHDSNFRKYFNT
jgi:hypothetical protein